jgi:spore germination protein
VSIAYIEGIANTEILNNLYTKVNAIKTDGLLSIGHIEQLISDTKYSPFPLYIATERPDKAVAALLEGRFVVFLDGTPVVLIAPVSFFSFFQAPDDYASNWMIGTMLRLFRIMGLILALILPALYISVTSFHYYLVPLNILVQLGQSRAQVAFPPIVEALLMEFTIEMLREASVRLPTYIGSTIGVVGGIIIGQAAVNAGIVSNLFIIIVGATTIASYAIPNYEFGLCIVLIRFGILLMSSFFGIIGVLVSIIFMIIHLLALESLGQPYLSPISPFKLSDQKDMIIRLPFQFMKKRPHIAQPINDKRGDKNE